MPTKKAARTGRKIPVAVSSLALEVKRLERVHTKAEDNLRHAEIKLLRARDKWRGSR